MINIEKYQTLLSSYKNSFTKHWKDEKSKWEAVKCFQDNWNIDAEDFSKMFEKATEKGAYLLTAARTFPRGMITEFAKADAEATRSMFRTLFDESLDLAFRVEAFRKSSDEIQLKYGKDKWNNHYQNTNAISTYLWLHYPDKYYIYKFKVYRAVAEQLGSDYHPKADGSVDSMIGGYQFYDEVCAELGKDEELKKLLGEVLTSSPECYTDPELKTLTIDFGFYISTYYPIEQNINANSGSGEGIIESSTRFTWIDFYTKFATKMLKYKDDRQALIEKIQRTYKKIKMSLPKLESDGMPVDIDPFTVFSLLNKRSDEDRIKIIQGLISEFSIDANVPDDFSGAAYNPHLMQPFYSITGNRKDDDIDNLWSMFEIAIEFAENDSIENRELFCKSYDQVQKQWNVARSLTAGLYWIRPYAYVNLDYRIQDVLKNPENLGPDIASKITSSVPSGKKYLDLRDSCLSAFSSGNYSYTSFPELSFKAWKVSNTDMESQNNNTNSDKKCWLISWNPENWDWYDYDRTCAKTTPEDTFIDSWSCTSKKPRIGDEIFLIKLGDKPRGIIGHGFVHRESYSGVHYDTGKAEKGKQSNYIDVEFDCLLNHKTEKILFQDDLKTQCPSQTWSPQSSGIEIKAEVVPSLQNLWKEITDNRSNEEDHTTMFDDSLFSKNMILYGPPGTGKTYNVVNYAVAICESKKYEDVKAEEYQNVLARFNHLKEEGRIAFTTFHQSYGYEEFIEGISPKTNPEDASKLEYEIRDGLFKAFCKRAQLVKVQSASGVQMKEQPRIWGMILGGTGMTELKKQCFANNEIRLGWTEVKDEDVEGDFIGDEQASWNAKHMVFDFKNSMEVGDIVVIEKNNKSIDAIGVITGEYVYDESHERYPRSRSVEWLVKDIDQNMVPFLPNGRKQLSRFSVFAFDYIGMDVISHLINEHTAESVVDVEQETKPYVFIIDEINRGNISKIFGELITLIEDTKRAGASEAMEARLPYSGESFSVPQNVYILGTMNTADRSIALMDTALRRRFDFVEMMPDTEILKGVVVEDQDTGVIVEIDKMLDAINKRIEILYDREHMIGHAYFMKLKDDNTLENLKEIFLNRIIPLLQEYFYDDYERIQLVLGDNDKEDAYKFIEDKDVKFREFFKGQPVDDVYDEKKIYRINKEAFDEIISYLKIYA